MLGQGIEQHDRLEIAVQVEHQVGIARLLQQQTAQAVEWRGGGWQCIDGLAHQASNQLHIVARVAAESALEVGRDHLGQLRELTVEVLPTGEIESALMGCLDHLRQADRVGDRHQFDHPGQAALLLQFAQQALEFHGHAHAGQFVGMQRCLDVGLARPVAKTEQRQAPLGARGAPGQDVLNVFHAEFLSACAVPGTPASGARPA
ncbi:hypothetical protein D3C80_456830 [compost metagenome]